MVGVIRLLALVFLITLTISGKAWGNPIISVSPSSVDFGNTSIGSLSCKTVRVYNEGTSTLTISSISLTDTLNYLEPSYSCPRNIAPNSYNSISLCFYPKSAGTKTAQFKIFSNAVNSPVKAINLEGTGTGPAISVTPYSLDFGTVDVNAAAHVFKVQNTGTEPLVVSSITLGGSYKEDYSVVSEECTQTPIQPNETCNITVAFQPKKIITYEDAYLLITSNAKNISTYYLYLGGRGTGKKILIEPNNPPVKDLGSIQLNTGGVSTTLMTITNIGDSTVNIDSINSSGDTSDIRIDTTLCPLTLLAGHSCAVWGHTLSTYVTTSGTKTITVTANTDAGLGSVLVTARFYGPLIWAEPECYDFGVISSCRTQEFEIKNIGDRDLVISEVYIDVLSEIFRVISHSCSTVPPGGSCTAVVEVCPPQETQAVRGKLTTHLKTSSNAANSHIGETLVAVLTAIVDPEPGIPINPILSASPPAVSFGSDYIGGSGIDKTVFIYNNGGGVVWIHSIEIEGEDADQFKISRPVFSDWNYSHICFANREAIGITLWAEKLGPISATLKLRTSAGNISVPLTGTGYGAMISVSPGQFYDFGTVRTGTSAQQKFTVTNIGDRNLNVSSISAGSPYSIVSHNCSTVPPGGNCELTVRLNAISEGIKPGIVYITSNAGNDTFAGMYYIYLTGKVIDTPKASVTPDSKDFENIEIGSQVMQRFKITNTGNGKLLIYLATISGPDMDDFSVEWTNCSSTSLSNGNYCSVDVIFRPTSIGLKQAFLNIYSNDPDNPHIQIPLTGQGVDSYIVTVSPSSWSYGDVTLNTQTTKTFTVTNIGTGTVVVTQPEISGTNSSDFSVTANNCNILSAGESCTFDVTFTPSSLGDRSASISLYSPPFGGMHIIPLTGKGIGSIISISPSSYNYGNIAVNSSTIKSFTVRNDGNINLVVSSITLSNTTDYRVFANYCSSISPGGICNIVIEFSPKSIGVKDAEMTVNSNAVGGNPTVSLTGQGTGAIISVDPTSKDFGEVTVNQTLRQTFAVTNNGNINLTISSIFLTDTTNYAIASNNCQPSGGIPPNATCTVEVSFKPTSTGTKNTTLRFYSNASNGSPYNISLTGVGINPVISISPASKNFGDVSVGTESSQSFTVRNTGVGTLTIYSMTLSDPINYSIDQSGCSTIPANGTCLFTVTFRPSFTGQQNSTLTVTSNASNGTQNIQLTGNGIGALLIIDPATADYGEVDVGLSSIKSFTISNIGNTPSIISSVTLLDSLNYTVVENTCTTLQPGNFCTIAVAFNPQSAGTKTTELRVYSDAGNGIQTSSLKGKGVTTNNSCTIIQSPEDNKSGVFILFIEPSQN